MDSQENVFGMYGDSRESLLEILEDVIILSPISSVHGKVAIEGPASTGGPLMG